MKILLLAEHDDAVLSAATLSAIAAARELQCPIHLLVTGMQCDKVSEAASQVAGLSKVLCAQAPYYVHTTAENMAALLQKMAPQYAYVMVAATVHGKALLPRLAAMLDVAPVSDVIRIVDGDTFERPTHAGNLQKIVQCQESVRLLSIRASAFRPVRDKQSPAPIEYIEAAADTQLSRVEGRDDASRREGRPPLASARVVVCGGNGFESVEDFYRLMEPLADELGAALGATRVLVDAGVPNNMQVGQSGISIAPDLYVAIGLSGAIQHLSGIQHSKCIVAINRDTRAPIMAHADYVLVGNAYRIVPRLTEAIRKFKAENN